MAGKNTGLTRTYQIEDAAGLALNYGVTYGTADGAVKKPLSDNLKMVGVSSTDAVVDNNMSAGGSQAGKDVAITVAGFGEIVLGTGGAAYGEELILATGGVAKKCPTADGTYNIIGIAEKAGAAGDVIPFVIKQYVKYIKA
jgi:hypothetical protein